MLRYRVETTPMVQAELSTMPRAAQLAVDRLRERLTVDPWDSEPVNPVNPAGNVREAVFGDEGQGLARFMIMDRDEGDEHVAVVRVLWLH